MLFHRGKVRFGDAHPVSKEGNRTLRIPASMYYSKLGEEKIENGEETMNYEILIHHHIPETRNKRIEDFQPKQCRSGFYDFEKRKANSKILLHEIKTEVHKSFALKSAYDRDMRRSADSQMYGYESLRKESEWAFSVYFDNDIDYKYIEQIRDSLRGELRIGRSRTAQYGLIQIDLLEEAGGNSTNKNISVLEKKKEMGNIEKYVLVYADARLIFLDKYGFPTFQPNPKDLGFENGEIDWEMSQIRTFQYAPWNFKRQARDTDRCGIEKESVFYIKQKGNDNVKYTEDDLVGSYQNEGFGKMIMNPAFLASEETVIGEYRYL